MKAKILKTFRDKYTEELYEPGQVVEMTEKRFAEVNASQYGVLAEKIEPPPVKKAPAKRAPAKKTTKK